MATVLYIIAGCAGVLILDLIISLIVKGGDKKTPPPEYHEPTPEELQEWEL